MKLAVLTTETTHHAYFVHKLKQTYSNLHVLVETTSVKPPFEISHPFEAKRNEYERQIWFDNEEIKIADLAECTYYERINEIAAIRHLYSLKPDVVIVFGTGIIKSEILNLMKDRIINLHGGDPESYRGLDTHLWAIYHNDFDELVTTIHHVNPILDDGRIIMRLEVPIHKNMKLYQLRESNTEICIKLAFLSLNLFSKEEFFPSTKQKQKGRYYSFMPNVIKQICVEKFEKYTENLQ